MSSNDNGEILVKLDHTARFFATDDGRWVWVVLKGRDQPFEPLPDNVVAVSGKRFDTYEQARADLLESTGGVIGSPDVIWVRKQ